MDRVTYAQGAEKWTTNSTFTVLINDEVVNSFWKTEDETFAKCFKNVFSRLFKKF